MKYTKRDTLPADQSYTLASLRRRALALGIDFVTIIVLFVLLIGFFSLFGIDIRTLNFKGYTSIELDANLSETANRILTVFFVSTPTAYFTICTWLWGQTAGKWLLGIRVVSLYHDHVGLWHSLERALGYIASSLEAGLGFLQALWNPNRMALHDKIAETIVVRITRETSSTPALVDGWEESRENPAAYA